MKVSHWVSVVLGAMVVGLASAEAQLTGTPALIVRIIVAVSGPVLAALGVTSPSALKSGASEAQKEEVK